MLNHGCPRQHEAVGRFRARRAGMAPTICRFLIQRDRLPSRGLNKKHLQISALRHWYTNCSILVESHIALRGLALEKQSRFLLITTIVLLVAGCGGKEDVATGPPLPTAATLGEQVVLAPAEYLASEPYSSANRSRGERQAQFCKACHSLEQGGRHMVGPALFGFFGTAVGTQSGFEYSAVMRNADFVWTPEALHAWLGQPGRFLPGNRMTFAGIPDEDDRNDLIAYLLEATTDEANN